MYEDNIYRVHLKYISVVILFYTIQCFIMKKMAFLKYNYDGNQFNQLFNDLSSDEITKSVSI